MHLLDAGSTVLRLNRFLFSNIQAQAAILNRQEISATISPYYAVFRYPEEPPVCLSV